MNLNATLIIEVAGFLLLMALLARFLYRPMLKLLLTDCSKRGLKPSRFASFTHITTRRMS